MLNECPTSAITDESLDLVAEFLLAQQLGAPPYSGGFNSWPARFVDRWVVLNLEYQIWKAAKTNASSQQR